VNAVHDHRGGARPPRRRAPEWKKAQDHLRAGMTAKQWNAMFETFRIAARAAQAPGT
jgi:hypothetical protein